MKTFNTETFIEDKSLYEICNLFNEAYDNVCKSLVEIRDITDNRKEIEKNEFPSSIDEALRINNLFYENGIEAMTIAFHRILGLKLFELMDFNENGERAYNIPEEDREKYDIPFDSIHELNSGEIWLTIGEDCHDDDELDANQMKKVAEYICKVEDVEDFAYHFIRSIHDNYEWRRELGFRKMKSLIKILEDENDNRIGWRKIGGDCRPELTEKQWEMVKNRLFDFYGDN